MTWDDDIVRPAGYVPPGDEVSRDVEVAEEIYRSIAPAHRAAMWRTYLTISDLDEASWS